MTPYCNGSKTASIRTKECRYELSTPGNVKRLRIGFALVLITSALLLLKHVQSGSVAIPTPQEKPGSKTNPIETKPSRRLFENRIPDHLPIKVKIKREKEKRFRDLENQNWVRDLELEVKNVGEKPIYFLFFYVVIPDAKIGDKPQGLSIVYGRAALSDLNNEPTADDVPINPGETKVLMIEDAGLKSWDDQITRRLLPARVRGARLIIQDLIFGDGTGFKSTGGVPVKRDKKPSGGAHFRLMDRYGGVRVAAVTGVSTIEDEKKPRCAGMFQPASFLSAGADFKLAPSRGLNPNATVRTSRAGMETSELSIQTQRTSFVINAVISSISPRLNASIRQLLVCRLDYQMVQQ